MVLDFNSEDFLDSCFDTLNPRITKFDYLTRICKNYVVMLFGSVRFFELCQVLPELMLSHQIACQEQFDGIV